MERVNITEMVGSGAIGRGATVDGSEGGIYWGTLVSYDNDCVRFPKGNFLANFSELYGYDKLRDEWVHEEQGEVILRSISVLTRADGINCVDAFHAAYRVTICCLSDLGLFRHKQRQIEHQVREWHMKQFLEWFERGDFR